MSGSQKQGYQDILLINEGVILTGIGFCINNKKMFCILLYNFYTLYLNELIIILFIIFIIYAIVEGFIIIKTPFYFILLIRCCYLFSLQNLIKTIINDYNF